VDAVNPLLVTWKGKPRPRQKPDVLSLSSRVENRSLAEDRVPGSRVQKIHRAPKGEKVTATKAQATVRGYRVIDKRFVDRNEP